MKRRPRAELNVCGHSSKEERICVRKTYVDRCAFQEKEMIFESGGEKGRKWLGSEFSGNGFEIQLNFGFDSAPYQNRNRYSLPFVGNFKFSFYLV